MSTAFVFDPKGNYQVVPRIRQAGVMPTVGLRYVASVTGPYKVFQVVDFDDLSEADDRLDSLPGGGGADDPPNAVVIGQAKVRRSRYLTHTALVRIGVSVPDPADLLDRIKDAIGADPDGGVEADVVAGDFDILACVVDDGEESLARKIFDIRRIEGVERTVSLRVIDYVSTSENAPDDHRVSAAG
jgi:hypothetical protein